MADLEARADAHNAFRLPRTALHCTALHCTAQVRRQTATYLEHDTRLEARANADDAVVHLAVAQEAAVGDDGLGDLAAGTRANEAETDGNGRQADN